MERTLPNADTRTPWNRKCVLSVALILGACVAVVCVGRGDWTAPMKVVLAPEAPAYPPISCEYFPGFGTGEYQKQLANTKTRAECAELVKATEPNANGATYSTNDNGQFPNECYAEMGMSGRYDDNKWQSCYFAVSTLTNGIYGTNNYGTTSCPTGFAQITEVDECRKAAAAYAVTMDENGWPDETQGQLWPSGCFINNADHVPLRVYFNQWSPGGASSRAAPLCIQQSSVPSTCLHGVISVALDDPSECSVEDGFDCNFDINHGFHFPDAKYVYIAPVFGNLGDCAMSFDVKIRHDPENWGNSGRLNAGTGDLFEGEVKSDRHGRYAYLHSEGGDGTGVARALWLHKDLESACSGVEGCKCTEDINYPRNSQYPYIEEHLYLCWV